MTVCTNPSPSEFLVLCYGLLFTWDLGPNSNIQVNLPWLRTLHGKPDELPYTFNILDGQAYTRSPDCKLHYPPGSSDCCISCTALGLALDKLGKSIPLYQPRTRRSLKNILQLSQTIDERFKELDHWKLKVRHSVSYKVSVLSIVN